MNSARLWRHGKEQFFAWLPALMMGLFALATAWASSLSLTALTLSRWFCACSTTVEADLRSARFCRLDLAW